MTVSSSPSLALLNAGEPSRSPEGTAMLAGLTGKHRQQARSFIGMPKTYLI